MSLAYIMKPHRKAIVVAVSFVAYCMPRWKWVRDLAAGIIAKQFFVGVAKNGNP